MGPRLKYYQKNPTNVHNRYFEQTSDDFFSSQADMLRTNKPDIVFIDGLHTYEQSLKDVLNSLTFLADGGVILMHDCNPLSEAAAYPAGSFEDVTSLNLPTYAGAWNGDVCKTIVHLRTLHRDLEVCVLNCDHGIGVVRKAVPENTLNLSASDLRNMSYHDLAADRERLLNLKSPEHFNDLVARIVSGSTVPGMTPQGVELKK